MPGTNYKIAQRQLKGRPEKDSEIDKAREKEREREGFKFKAGLPHGAGGGAHGIGVLPQTKHLPANLLLFIFMFPLPPLPPPSCCPSGL